MGFTLKDLAGVEVSLSDFEGKKVFLNFWATWCPPCDGEMPFINEIHKEYKDIQIITINLKEDKKIVEDYIAKGNYEFKVLLDTDGTVGNKYGANFIPLSVLIDEDGKVINTYTGSMTKEELIRFMQLD